MERQLSVQRADLLTIAVSCDRYDTVCVPKLRCFQQRERRDALTRGKLKSICNERIVLVAANFHPIGIVRAVVSELGFYAGFSDQSI